MSTHVLLPLAINSKSEQKVDLTATAGIGVSGKWSACLCAFVHMHYHSMCLLLCLLPCTSTLRLPYSSFVDMSSSVMSLYFCRQFVMLFFSFVFKVWVASQVVSACALVFSWILFFFFVFYLLHHRHHRVCEFSVMKI
jgi:hypothetical protein